ncbi:excinuclease ABC subunit UvrC [Alkaliflexus imshenetskii]|uniref:excinuclease ABC subunit UvrC n=1 Tax=Alkaliflexus imshenetskii TaxID=286730 RepID=UPI0004B3504B|nr:excinuclease ABC subunit UvrC [Alkaliflexus imshenetskii]
MSFLLANSHLESLRGIVVTLPTNPGVYQFFDENDRIIYVGKAKNLKRRVASYFNREPENGKTRVLVKKIRTIRHIVVDTEEDALLLENNLIKKYQPRYNVLLKDDKSFPWIVVRNEPFPRVYQTRQLIRDGSLYFGPYTSVVMVRTLIELFRHLYPIRTCRLQLTADNIAKGKFKRCLEYHLGNCKAPCEGLQTEADYQNYIEDIRNILKGNIGSVIRYLKDLMHQYATDYKFEEAEEIKQRIKLLTGFQSKSTIVNPKIDNVDVFSILSDEKSAYINFLKVLNGAIVQAHTIEYKKRLQESESELLSLAIVEIRDRLQSNAPEIILPFKPDVTLKGVEFTIPQIGDKKKLLELSERNTKFYRLEKLKQESNNLKTPRHVQLLETVQKDLRLKQLPVHIECFDNSNIQGAYPVAACVVFKNGKPSKKDYRHFNIKTVEGPNDFASMEEVVHRRYRRMLEEGSSLPQLIVIDGGKGQLGSAMNALNELNLGDKIAIIGIAKRLEEIFYPGDPVPLYLDKNTPSLKLIQHLRNEAHRFGISFHRDKRSKGAFVSKLESIPGIGSKTMESLLNRFKSLSGVKSASFDELKDVVGAARAKSIQDYFGQDIAKK